MQATDTAAGGRAQVLFSARSREAQQDQDLAIGPSADRFPLTGLPASMMVETMSGLRAVTDLAAGMQVRTLAGGWQAVRAAVTVRHNLSRGDATPVILRGGALGDGPGHDVNMPAAQRIVIDSPRAVQVAGGRRVAIPAAHLGHLADVRPLALSTASFVHVLLDGVDAVLADGLWLETFHPCPASLAALGHAGHRAMVLAAPRLAHHAGHAQYVAPWRVLSAREAEDVI